MSIKLIPISEQASGAFNGGEIIENKPLGFPSDGGDLKPYSSIFYWANAIAKADSTIGLHPHQGFEIMSFVLEGEIKHYDTQLDDWKELSKGDVQVIRAGSGISHAEHMAKDSRMFQIWLDPSLSKTMTQPASYSDYKASIFPSIEYDNINIISYVGDSGMVQLDTPNISIEKWQLSGDHDLRITDGEIYSIYILEGQISISGQTALKDTFVLIEDEEYIKLSGEAELFVIKSKARLSYPTYGQLLQNRLS